MPGFASDREIVGRFRQQAAEAEQEVLVSRVRLRQAEQARRDFVRRARPGDRRDAERLRQLDLALERARAEADEARRRGQRLTVELSGALSDFGERYDPRRSLAELDDGTPLLLLPLRVETRFKRLDAGTELWVRVFPDECLVDSFEPLLSDSERREGRGFWMRWWRSGGVEAERRAAWRLLVAGTSSARAAWIVRELRPKNESDEPVKVTPTETILVVPCTALPSAGEQAAIAQHWIARWREPAAAHGVAPALTPFNLADEPTAPETRATAAVRVVFLALPEEDAVATPPGSWNSAPVTRAMPERLVLRLEQAGAPPVEVIGHAIPSPLAVGPDPDAAEADQLAQHDGLLDVPPSLRWMVDFEEAVRVGMAFRVPLSTAQSTSGFDRLMVIGVRMSSDARAGAATLSELITHHRFGASGFVLIGQGAATNNTESARAGYQSLDDPDASFEAMFLTPRIVRQEAWEERSDGQWLAELLGLGTDVVDGVERSMGRDQIVARAVNIALWPATLGYTLETLLHPLFSGDTVDALRWFFTRCVSGRGWAPAIRIGGQPYGILPTSAMRRWQWITDRMSLDLAGAGATGPVSTVVRPLLHTMREIEADWDELSTGVAAVGRPGDPHQTLLDILGLHPTSVEFHQRFSQSLESVRARLRFFGELRRGTSRVLEVAEWQDEARRLLRELGYNDSTDPEILAQIFYGAQQPLRGPLVDDRPVSERDAIRAYTGDGRNYLRWLIDAARASLDDLRGESGFTGDQSPTAMLYLLSRHALMLGYWDTSVRLYVIGGALDAAARATVRREPAFVHVSTETATSESRWGLLYADEPRVTGTSGRMVAEHITSTLGSDTTRLLDEQLAALERLERVPTAPLERAFVEHLDCASYRLDAWVQGLIQLQLGVMRYGPGRGGEPARSGIHLGAFGWLEEVRPRSRQHRDVTLDPSLKDFFDPDGAPPLIRDEANGGYMLAPSLNHAVTAAVLRSGHLANATPANATTLAVNLSSARVRLAQQMLEGIRNGQSLGALLGYRFERGLHDRHDMAEVDRFILPLRKQFPLRADRLETTRTDPSVAIESIEARNVIDGRLLIERVRTSGIQSYPFGLEQVLPDATPAQSAAINVEVEALLDAHDALADLALAESVHQAAQGNFERAAANLDAYGHGGLPPDPDVVRTPLGGTTLTHRVALHLPVDASHTASPVPLLPMTPRAACEPRLNAWLASRLPVPERVYARVRVTDAVTRTSTALEITQRDLGLQPIDLLNCSVDSSDQGMSELEDRIVRHAASLMALRPDAVVEIRFSELVVDRSRISFFEIAPLVRALRNLVSHARPLRPTDLRLSGEASGADDESIRIEAARVSDARAALAAAHGVLGPIAATLAARVADVDANRAVLLAEADATVTAAAHAAATLMSFGVRAAIGEWHAWRAATTRRLVALVAERVEKWRIRRNAAEARLTAYDALPPGTPDDVRFAELEAIERLVAAQSTIPRPASTDLSRDAAGDALTAFDARRALLAGAVGSPLPTLAAVRAAIAAQLPLDAFDVEPFTLDTIDSEVLRFLGELSSTLGAILTEVEQRLLMSQRALADAAAATGSGQVDALTRGAKAVFGEDFRIVPFFDVPLEVRGELANANAHHASGELLRFQVVEQGNREPVDTWLYGAARVRLPLRLWEQVMMHSEAFGAPPLTLTPLQLPAQPPSAWLALAYPPTTNIDGEWLCYTAHFPQVFDPDGPQCGLLIDEWPEVLPASEQTPAVAFHFDRPNAEPPQTWLLATPSQFGRGWSWEDVVESIREAFERARRRAVEPAHLDATAYARFLPAAVMATTLFPIAISTNLARNNGLLRALEDGPNG